MSRRFTSFLIAAMLLGILTGWICNQALTPDQGKVVAENLSIITDVFLRLIKMIIAPLVFTTLVAGIAHMGDASEVGRVGVKTIGWFIMASLVSLTIGLVMVHIIQPGSGLSLVAPPIDDAGCFCRFHSPPYSSGA